MRPIAVGRGLRSHSPNCCCPCWLQGDWNQLVVRLLKYEFNPPHSRVMECMVPTAYRSEGNVQQLPVAKIFPPYPALAVVTLVALVALVTSFLAGLLCDGGPCCTPS
ncbi:hypothetical protein XPA_002046 [Xanthoria parietina]